MGAHNDPRRTIRRAAKTLKETKASIALTPSAVGRRKCQLEAMDIEGIDIAVLYPTRGLRALVVPDMDAEFAAAIARAYNDWLYDFCQKDPKRLIGAGMISPYTMNDAVS